MSSVQPGQHITVRRWLPDPVRGRWPHTEHTHAAKHGGGRIGRAGNCLLGQDQVTPALDSPLSSHEHIQITRVREDVLYEDERIPFSTVWQPDDNLPIDQRVVANPGQEGILRQRYRVRYEDGEEVKRELEASWSAAQPQNKVIAYGRKITPQTLDTPDGPITYWRRIRAYANSYSPARSGTPKSAPWYGRTRLGMALEKGVVAVDPSVINLRQQLYVPGYGQAIAGDTGGGVQGKWVDLGYDDASYRSWHWWTEVYLFGRLRPAIPFATSCPTGRDFQQRLEQGVTDTNPPVSLLPDLRALGMFPRKNLGSIICRIRETFILAGIVKAAELPADAVVIEVGPGPGTLTAALLPRGGAGWSPSNLTIPWPIC